DYDWSLRGPPKCATYGQKCRTWSPPNCCWNLRCKAFRCRPR
uniref:Tachystatin-C n=1 Tax=Tachypleus tridentatus TaxID=6853 RepID=TACHC_TACTR|nr:RecName: Full=Tachystatin-C [Tachypleus tridentatus]